MQSGTGKGAQRRTEVRVEKQLPVRIWGMDGNGRAFLQQATTFNLSRNGAGVEGVHCWQRAGEVVGLAFGEKKGRFRVMWVANDADGQVGLRAIGSEVPWEQELPESAVQTAPRPIVEHPLPKPALTWGDTTREPRSGLGSNRREHTRYQVSGGAQVRQLGVSGVSWCRLVDLSLGGCYVESLKTFVPGTKVQVIVGAADIQFRTTGEVTTAHPGFGFALKFVNLGLKDRDALQQLMLKLAEGKLPR